MHKPGQASIETVPDLLPTHEGLLLKVRMVGFCGSDSAGWTRCLPHGNGEFPSVQKAAIHIVPSDSTKDHQEIQDGHYAL